MTKLRAFYGALACGAVSLTIGVAAQADTSNFTIQTGSKQSRVDNACVGALPGVTLEDCTYNRSNPSDGSISGNPIPWVGPVYGAGYYPTGSSPFLTLPPESGGQLALAPVPDPNKVGLDVTGTLILDDINGTECDGDDTLEGRFTLAPGTRTFAGGPGTWGEETWGADTINYVLPPTVANQQNPSAMGCEYIFASAGWPTLIQTMGLSPAGVQTYPVDLTIGSDPIDMNPPDSEQDAWAAPEPSGIGVAQFEGPLAGGNQGNFGLRIFLDEAAFFAGTWSCVDNLATDPMVPTSEVAGGVCSLGPRAIDTPCDKTGSHFCGVRGIGNPNFASEDPPRSPDDGRGQENWLIRILVDPAGNITEGSIFANNESVVFGVSPQPDGRNNSYDGPLITFTASCDDCSVAKNDTYRFVTGTTSPATLDIGANDDVLFQLDNTNTSLAIDAPGPTRGTCDVSANNPGDVANIACVYTATDNFAGAGTDTFTYTLDDGILGAASGLQATIVVEVQDDVAPVANAYEIMFDSTGVSPQTLNDIRDALTGVAGNVGGNNPAVSVDDALTTSGTVSIVNGTEIRYQANADFFQGTDQFSYQIDDDNFGSPGTMTETGGPAQATVTIPNVLPTTTDVTAEVAAGESVGVTAAITAGNGTVDQHTVTGACDDGDIVIDSVGDNAGVIEVNATYSAPAGFAGDTMCTYTITDEDGNGDPVDGIITITVIDSAAVKLPGAGSAISPTGLALLLLIPWLRRRSAKLDATLNSGAK